MWSAARTARSASSSWATGAPKSATMASPTILSTRPPHAVTSAASRAKHRSRMALTCSGSRCFGHRREADDVGEQHRRDSSFVNGPCCGRPHTEQNRAASGSWLPQAGHDTPPRLDVGATCGTLTSWSVERKRRRAVAYDETCREARASGLDRDRDSWLAARPLRPCADRRESQLEAHVIAIGAVAGVDDQYIVGPVRKRKHGESLANKGFLVQPKMKVLVVQGKCLTCTPENLFHCMELPQTPGGGGEQNRACRGRCDELGTRQTRCREGGDGGHRDGDRADTRRRQGVGLRVRNVQPVVAGRPYRTQPADRGTGPIAASKGVRFTPASAFKSALNSKGGAKKAAPAKKAAKSCTRQEGDRSQEGSGEEGREIGQEEVERRLSMTPAKKQLRRRKATTSTPQDRCPDRSHDRPEDHGGRDQDCRPRRRPPRPGRQPRRRPAPAKRSTAAKKTTAKRSTAAKKAPARRTAAATKAPAIRKTAAKKATAIKKTAAKKATAIKKTAAKKAAVIQKTAAKKATAIKKTAAKRASAVKK